MESQKNIATFVVEKRIIIIVNMKYFWLIKRGKG